MTVQGERRARGAHAGGRPPGWWRPRGRLWSDVAIIGTALIIEYTLSGVNGKTRFGFTIPSWVMALIALLVFSTLFWRRRFPWPVYAITMIHGMTVAFVAPYYQPFTGVLLGMYGVARYAPRKQALAALFGTIIVWAITTYNTTTFDSDWTVEDGWGTPVGAFAVFFGMAAAVYTYARGRRRIDEMETLRVRARDSDIALRLQEDRVATARDLHDRVSNSIAATMMGLDSLSTFAASLPPHGVNSLEVTRNAAGQAMNQIRDVLGVLRNDEREIEDDEPQPDLEEMLVELQRNGIGGVEVQVTHRGEIVELGDEVSECAAMCIREAVTNAAKYGEERAEIGIDWREDPIIITVRNAKSYRELSEPALRGGTGLSGIIDRVTVLGGSVMLEADRHTFTLRIRLPRF